IILLILLILSYRKQKNSRNPSTAENQDQIQKNDVNQSMAIDTPNLHTKTDLNDLYTQVDVKTKVPKSERSVAKNETDEATWALGAAQYHSIADVDNYNVEQKVDDCKPLDEANDLYTQVDDKTKVPKPERSVAKKETDESKWTIDAADTTQYHTIADVDDYSLEQKEDDCEIPEGIELMKNEIYSGTKN
ncbi:unnamed protein product, partial [Owenia fusiformis]